MLSNKLYRYACQGYILALLVTGGTYADEPSNSDKGPPERREDSESAGRAHGGWTSCPITITPNPASPRKLKPGGYSMKELKEQTFLDDGSVKLFTYKAYKNKSQDFSPYLADMRRRIKRALYLPEFKESKQLVIGWTIDYLGNMKNLEITAPSGLHELDSAVFQAVSNAAPFRPLPSQGPEAVYVEMSFKFN